MRRGGDGIFRARPVSVSSRAIIVASYERVLWILILLSDFWFLNFFRQLF